MPESHSPMKAVWGCTLGFVHIGTYPEVGFKLGKWHDVGYWRLGLCQATPPLEPVLFPELEVSSQ